MKNIVITILILCLTIMVPISPVHAEEATYESYFNHIGTAPDQAESEYAEEVNGITHDRDNWFIAQSENAHPWRLWKIPLGIHLAATFDCGDMVGPHRVVCRYLDDYSQLSAYNHVGDIDYYQYNESTGFLLLPLEDYPDKAVPSAIAAFNPVNLQYIAHAELDKPQGLPQAKNCPWIAVGPDGLVYTTHDGAQGLVWKYQTNWEMLAQKKGMTLQYVGNLQFFDESCKPFAVGGQGGVFSESGNLFYSTNGYYKSFNSHRDGISVFDMQTKQRIRHSTRDCTQPFCYDYITWGEWEEPEGLTIWDLDDDPRAPQGMSGQLHVLLLDNDWAFGDDDDVYVMHYTNKIYVDKDNIGDENGKPDKPFNTVGEALAMAWNGARISIKAGTYPESLTFSKRIQVLAEGGTVIIGT
jgi:hypothetical protein